MTIITGLIEAGELVTPIEPILIQSLFLTSVTNWMVMTIISGMNRAGNLTTPV